MHWLKQNTPEPMGNPEAYYQLDEVPGEGGYKYPPSAYGVTAWWDYGYWISRTAHRIPSANPSQAPGPITKVANLFLANDEASTYAMMKELGSSYIIIDFSTCTTKFWAVNTWAGRDPSEFVGTYYVAKEGNLVGVQLFLPEYYRTLCVRLYNFNGKAVEAKNPAVITFEKKVDNNGNSFEQITDIKQFASYQEALDNVAKEGAASHRIIGLNPFVSPVPLEAVQDYKLIYSSESGISNQDVGLVPEVKIFEYPGK
jgi:asparagine N-glycosylation enzyme membrane subunit Stt3